MQMWLRSDTGITEVAGKVTEWRDLSSLHNDCTQPDTATQPTLTGPLSELYGRSAVVFDGVDDYMMFLNRINNIRTAFFLVKHRTGNSPPGFQPILGDNLGYDFIGDQGGDRIFDSTYSSTNILSGSIRVNGNPLPSVKSAVKPTQYSVISLVTSGNVAASQITRDRAISSRVWDGNYVEIILFSRVLSQQEIEEVENYLFNYYTPDLLVGSIQVPAASNCVPASAVTITADPNFTGHQWSHGDTGQSTSVTAFGEYIVSATSIFGKLVTDTVRVSPPMPVFNYPARLFCSGSTLTWDPGLSTSLYSFDWSTSGTDSILQITTPGTYSLEVTDTNQCVFNSDTLVIEVDLFPDILTLGPDTTYCYGSILPVLNGIQPGNEYLWSNGDTLSYTTFYSTGLYWIQATDTNGCVAIDSIYVTMAGIAATPAFTYGTTCNNVPVQFTDTSVPPASAIVETWNWSFDDNTTSNSQNPLHSFPLAGSYNVTLTVKTSEGCISTIVTPVNVTSKPDVNFESTNGCQFSPVEFYNTTTSSETINSYLWDFGSSVSPDDTSHMSSPDYVYQNTGVYSVTLIVTTAFNCSDTISKPVIVNPKPVANFITTALCEGQTAWFNDSSDIAFPWNIIPGSVKYDFGDGDFGSNPTMSHTFQDTGTYLVTYLFTASNGCRDTVQKSVHVYSMPVAGFVSPNICKGQEVSFTSSSVSVDDRISSWIWSFDSVDLGFDSTYAYSPESLDSLQVKLLVKTRHGCSDSETKMIAVHDSPTADFSVSDTRSDAPALITFTNTSSGASSYLFDFADNSGTQQSFPASHIYATPGSYTPSLVAISPFGCRDTTYQELLVLEKYLDVAVNNLTYAVADSFLTVTAEFVNLSSSDVNSLDLVLELQDGGVVRDQLTSVIRYQGAPVVHTFSGMRVTSENNSFCVKALNPNGEADMKPDDNSVCRSISELSYQAVLYPNPAGDHISVDLHSLTDAMVDLAFYDSRGSLVKTRSSISILKGITRYTLDISDLDKGIYNLRIVFNDQDMIKKLIKE